jgi:hypothetical protein
VYGGSTVEPPPRKVELVERPQCVAVQGTDADVERVAVVRFG